MSATTTTPLDDIATIIEKTRPGPPRKCHTIDHPRDTFYVTLPTGQFREWLEEELVQIEDALQSHAECFAVAGHIFPAPHTLTGQEAADTLRRSREQADDDLDRRSVCLALLERVAAHQ